MPAPNEIAVPQLSRLIATPSCPQTMRIPHKALPAPVGGQSLLVTRSRSRIDRLACPWLIRRFIDAEARYLFVSPGEAAGVVAYDALYRWAPNWQDEPHDD